MNEKSLDYDYLSLNRVVSTHSFEQFNVFRRRRMKVVRGVHVLVYVLASTVRAF